MKKNYVILVDWDGNFADSNGVKDARLNTFCKQEFGEIPVEKKSPKIAKSRSCSRSYPLIKQFHYSQP